MTTDFILKTSIRIQAPASEVWKALTDPELIKKYFFGTTVNSTWKEGEPIVFTGTWEGKEYEDKGTILKIERERLFRYNYWSNFSGTEDIPENYANIEYQLEESSGETILTVTQDGFKDKEAMEHSESSWNTVLNDMKKLIEK